MARRRLTWKPTYDRHRTREAARRDAARRRRRSGRYSYFRVVRSGEFWTVQYAERD